jgi:hypothetical protein
MKTKIELEEDIMNIIAKIHNEFPELSKYITEMPFNGVENDEVLIDNLQDYYATLEDLVDKYAKTHLEKTAQKGE